MANSSTTMTASDEPAPTSGRLAWSLVADDSDGSFVDATFTGIEGRITALETVPGGTAPTNGWDVVLNDPEGFDILGGAGANRTQVSQRAAVTAGYFNRNLTYTLAVSGNVVNSAEAEVELYWTNQA